MTGQEKISDSLLYPVLVPTIATHHLPLPNFGLEKESVQIPPHLLGESFAFRGSVDGTNRVWRINRRG